MADFNDLVDVLVDVSIADGNTNWLDKIYLDAKNAITEGKGTISVLTSSGLNGKNFNRSIQMGPLDVIKACIRAREIYDGEDSYFTSTNADFRKLIR